MAVQNQEAHYAYMDTSNTIPARDGHTHLLKKKNILAHKHVHYSSHKLVANQSLIVSMYS